MLGMILFIVFMLVAVGLFGKIIYDTESTLKNPIEHLNYKKILLNMLYFALGGAVAFTLAINFIYLWANIAPKAYQLVFAIICTFLFYFALEAFYVTFRLHYWKINLPENVKKLLFKIFAISIPVSIVCLFYSFNGFAEYLTYPLVNGNWHCDLVPTNGTVHEPPRAQHTIPAIAANRQRSRWTSP